MWQWLKRWLGYPVREAEDWSPYDHYVDPREPFYDDPDFTPAGGRWASDDQKRGENKIAYRNEQELKIIRDESRVLMEENEFAINAGTNRQSYVVHTGYQYKATPLPGYPQSLADGAQSVITDFVARTALGTRAREAVWRCDRDGEFFLRLFRLGNGLADVRWVEPEHVTDPTGRPECSFGKICERNDVETVLAYSVIEDPANRTIAIVPAQEILHVKLNTDSSCKRGLPTMYPVRKNLRRAERLLRNMSTLAEAQSAIVLLRRHKQMGNSAISAFKGTQADQTVRSPTGRQRHLQSIPPGSIVDTNDQTEYEFPASKVNGASLVDILQAGLRAIAVRLILPEYMLTGKLEGPFAVTLMAESPTTRNFEALQSIFKCAFGDGPYSPGPACGLLWRVLEIAVFGGRLHPDTLRGVSLQAEAPTLVVRDKAAETSRCQKLNEAGIMSLQTWAKLENLDYDQERAQIRREGEIACGASGPPPSPELPKSAPPGSASGDSALQ